MRMHLKPLALAATIGAAALLSVVPSAQADLVGRWISGAPDLTESSGYRPAGTHDGVAVGTNAGSLAFSTDVPAGFSGRSLDLIGNVGVSIANSSTADGGTYQNTYDGGISSQCTITFWAKGFPGTWNPWVAKQGESAGWQVRRMIDSNVAGFTLRGVTNTDGLGSTINVNNSPPVWRHFAGVWDQTTGTRKLYVDGVFSHTVTNTAGQNMALAANQRLTLGARADGGTGYGNYFTGKLYDVRIYNTPLTQSEIVALILTAPAGLVAAPGNGKIGLVWTPVNGATGYTVWTKNTVTNIEQTDTTTDAFFTKTSLDNGTPYLFKVMATNSSGTSAYSAEVGATPAISSAKDILSFSFGTYGNATTISGTNITKYLPSNINLTNLAPTYTTSLFATGSPVSGTARDFTFPQTYTITAEDGTTKDYTVTVALVSPITYNFTGGLQGWTQLQPTLPAVLWENNALGSGHDGIAPTNDTFTRFGRSPVFYLLDSGPLTFDLNGGQSPLAAPHVGPSAIPAGAIENGGFGGVALRDVATDTYVLSRRKTGNGGVYQPFQFTAAELAPFVNDGKQYTLDYLDYNRGGWGWTYMDNVSIPGVATQPGTEASIASVKITPLSVPQVSEISGTNITLWLAHGTSVTALNPLITISPGASISPPLGTVRNFTTPQTYTVTSGNSAVSNEYTVTVVTAGSLNLKTYDTTSDASLMDPISNLMAVTPSAIGTQVADIFYGNFAASLPGLTSNDTFSVLWEGWFDVSKDGPGDYTFGTQSDDGSMIYLDLNNDGDFTDLGELVVNNNGLHAYDIRTATVNLPMDSVRIAIGYFEATAGEGMDARFQRGTGLAFTALQRIGGRTGHFRASEPASNPASAALWYLTSSGRVAQPYGSPTQLLLALPVGTPVTNLTPTFTISPGATCNPPSGTGRDFTTPQTYTVTSANFSTITQYTVTVVLYQSYDFNDGSLQGWQNRVWDLAANGGAGGWIELAPNATTMPATVNGGAIQPPSVDNGLFALNGGQVYPNGNNDNHLNTHWLRSPAFTLDAATDLTLQLRGGIAKIANPASEAAVPNAAVPNGGWKGVVLRRVSNGEFLLAKPRTGANGDAWQTITFTAADLTPYDGVACTLELINSDRGGWGWVAMDNVIIPTTGMVATAPYDSWRAQYPTLVGAAGAPTGNPDGDSLNNLQEYAFGTQPTVSTGEISYVLNGSVTPGAPKTFPNVPANGMYSMVFGRRDDYVIAGLTYTVQFSAGLDTWADNNDTNNPPVQVATDGTINAMSVPYPDFITTTSGTQKPTFARVKVVLAP